MRRHLGQFRDSDVAIVVVGPDDREAFQKHFATYDMPFIGIPDPELRILNLYGQQTKLLRMGRMPAQVMLDTTGHVRYTHYGSLMSDIPSVAELLTVAASF